MGENTAHALAGHMLNRPTQGSARSRATDTRASPRTPPSELLSAPARPSHRAPRTRSQAPGHGFDHAKVASDVRQALRYGAGV